jgi:2-dehydro-3-deoxygluconokinase
MTRVASIGECMLELSAAGATPELRRLGFGGDTLNTAVYLARLGLAVDYVTALGDEPYSEHMVEAWRGEGVGTDWVQRIPGRLPGLYMIEVDAEGERRFFYWRQQAPAREIFANDRTDALCRALLSYDWLYVSGISLSLYGEAGRERLFDLLRQFRAEGGKVAFDSNYRPRGWPSVEVARREIRDQLALTDIVLSSL